MSHFTVAVIVPKDRKESELENYIDHIMEPFDEGIEVEPYIALTKEELLVKYNEYKERGDNSNLTFEEFSDDYCGYGNDEEGNALSTYNPNAKWDWYEIGGRWNGLIETKDFKNVNYARIKDIVLTKKFDDLEKQKIKNEYKELIEKGDFYKPEYYQERYPNFDSYLESFNFSTYALLDKDGNWHEPGQMGWFGMSLASIQDEIDFKQKYNDIVNSQDPADWIVVVDCHI